MTITGNFRGLHKLTDDVARLADPAWRRGLAQNLGEEALNQVAEGFARTRDPSGRKWKRSGRVVERGGQTLSMTARLRRSFAAGGVDASPSGFRIGSNVLYAKVHQYGAIIKARNRPFLTFRTPDGGWVKVKRVRIPIRRMIPERELGPIWGPAIEDAALAYAEATFV